MIVTEDRWVATVTVRTTDTTPAGSKPGRPLGFGIARVVDDAMRTFWELGWRGTSVSVLEERTGVARSSLANTFGPKRELYLAALRRYAGIVDELLLDPLANGADGISDVLQFFEKLRSSKSSAPGSWGCLMAVSMSELGADDPDVESETRAYRERLIAAFEAALTRAEAEGEIQLGDAATFAAGFAATVIGINVAARAGATSNELDALVSGISDLGLRKRDEQRPSVDS